MIPQNKTAMTEEQVTATVTNGDEMIVVDKQDEWLLSFKWRAHRDKKTTYARTTIIREGWKKDIFLHRAIMRPTSQQVVDHKNGDGMDCRRSNLRVCSKAENNRNFRPHGKTSKFKGVSWRAKDECWVMQIHIPNSGKKRITELFPKDQEEQAARRHDHWAKEFHGEYAYLNFPQSLHD